MVLDIRADFVLPARRKQGGSQSINDNAKGPAKSAGAQLRRYGEQALRDVSGFVRSMEVKVIANCFVFLSLGYSCATGRVEGGTPELRENIYTSKCLQPADFSRLRRISYLEGYADPHILLTITLHPHSP